MLPPLTVEPARETLELGGGSRARQRKPTLRTQPTRTERPEHAAGGTDCHGLASSHHSKKALMDRLVMARAIFIVLGLLGFAIPIFTTQHTEDVVRIGDLKVQTTESTSHSIPPILSGVLLFLALY
jgi:hypothetical protein